MSTRVELRGRHYYLGDEELFVRVTETAYDPEFEVVTYDIRTVWADGQGVWQEYRQINVSLDYHAEQAACLAGFTAELQPAQLLYHEDPDTVPVAVAVATLIGGGEIRYVIYA